MTAALAEALPASLEDDLAGMEQRLRRVARGMERLGASGRIVVAIVERPVLTLLDGVLVFGALAACATGYVAGGFSSGSDAPSGSDAQAGTVALLGRWNWWPCCPW